MNPDNIICIVEDEVPTTTNYEVIDPATEYTFTISATPADATVVINGETRTSLTANENTEITWSVGKTGYVTQTGTYTLVENHTETVTLVAIPTHTITFIPVDSHSGHVVNDVSTTINDGTSHMGEFTETVEDGTTIHYVVTAGNTAIIKSEDFTINQDTTITVQIPSHGEAFAWTNSRDTVFTETYDCTAQWVETTSGMAGTFETGIIVNGLYTELTITGPPYTRTPANDAPASPF